MRHRWITAKTFENELVTMIDAHRRVGFAEPIPAPTRQQIDQAAAIVVTANEPVRPLSVQRSRRQGQLRVLRVDQATRVFNGNKRVATFFLLDLLEVHGYMLETDPVELAEFARQVADSNPADREKVMKRIMGRVKRDTTTIEEFTGRDSVITSSLDIFHRRRDD